MKDNVNYEFYCSNSNIFSAKKTLKNTLIRKSRIRTKQNKQLNIKNLKNFPVEIIAT
jgi:hypothetical protein